LSARAQVFKCVIDGVTSFQSAPCPTGKQPDAPTADRLNAERKKRQQEAREAGIEEEKPARSYSYTGWPTAPVEPAESAASRPKPSAPASAANSGGCPPKCEVMLAKSLRGRGRRR
jgi:hypothetical protein